MKPFVVFLVVAACLMATAMTPRGASAARYPLNTWSTGCNTFWATCVAPYHTGVDATASPGTQEYAPFGSYIKEVQYHAGYGGTIVGQTYLAGETITWIIGHLDGARFLVTPGQWVNEGQPIGYAAAYGKWSGYYAPHCHFGTHYGAYSCCAKACDGEWYLHGYAAGCDWGAWINPELCVPFANVHYAQGDIARVGYPQGGMQYDRMDYRVYNGGSYGECIIAKGNNGCWLVRTGFFDRYKSMGMAASTLGKPRSNEYAAWVPQLNRTLARQDFDGGYMVWNNAAYVYNNSNARIASAEPVADETSMTPPLNLAVSPNPARSEAGVTLSLPTAEAVQLSLYDVAGRELGTIADGTFEPGVHRFTWNLCDKSGSKVQAGIYFVQARAGASLLTKKLVVGQ